VNWQHLRTFLWLRWRLFLNQSRRGGQINAVLTMIIAIAVMVMALPAFAASFVASLLLTPRLSPLELMYVADVLVGVFLFFWAMGLVAELQRTETLSVDRFLHLPVSVRGVFALNYFSSLVRLSVLVFGPILFGLALALPFTKGVWMLVALPLTAAMFLLVSALSYQFQGWLASLMANPRRRRTVTVMSIGTFVLLCQLPQLLNIIRPWQPPAEQTEARDKELAELLHQLQAAEITPEQYTARSEEVNQRFGAAEQQRLLQMQSDGERLAIRLNQFIPIGWLPYGILSAAQRSVLPAFLCLTGMALLGSLSLWRAYRTTLRLYQGGFSSGQAPRVRPLPAKAKTTDRAAGQTMLEWRLPGVSEPVSAVALAGFRSLLRAPEAKMMLLTPLLMGGIFGAMLVTNAPEMPVQARPLLALGGMMLVLFGLLQIMGNQFGFDRDGFRTFVLSAAGRREILLGKNLAFAPFACGLFATMLVVVEIVCPLNFWQVVAALAQFMSVFLLFCLVMNLFSIYTPQRIGAGSMKASHPKLLTVFLQMIMFSFLFPLTIVPAAVPLAVGALLDWDGRIAGSPVSLALSLMLCAAVATGYHFGLDLQARELQKREQKILDTITNRAA
jgi:hypothetical protein